jgi:hypothetical protein
MRTSRFSHTATLLADGLVLAAGGMGTATAELYDPFSGTFIAIGNMTAARESHTATLLPDGRVLMAGGRNLSSTELYDPASRTFTPTGSMAKVRFGHTAILLNTGKVLLAGGLTSVYLNTAPAEIYVPPQAHSHLLVPMPVVTRFIHRREDRQGQRQPLLRDGKVLIAGSNPAQLYDPRTNSFSLTSAMTMNQFKFGMFWHTASLLRNGKVLVTGGSDDFTGPLAAAELYDPSTQSFAGVGNMFAARDLHTAALLNDGTLLLVGGGDGWFGNSNLSNAEMYDPQTNTFKATGSMSTRRSGHTATLLKDGSAELYDPQTGTFSATGGMTADRRLVRELPDGYWTPKETGLQSAAPMPHHGELARLDCELSVRPGSCCGRWRRHARGRGRDARPLTLMNRSE